MEEVPANKAIETTPAVTIPIEYYLPENVPIYYSDSALILHSAHEFVVSFLQTDFPLATSKEELEQVKSVRRRCVARVLMSPAQFEVLVKAMQENWDKYAASYNKP